MTILERIEALYLWRGRRPCEPGLAKPVSVLEHSLQAAELAEWDDAGHTMIAAALLHDIGRLLPLPPGADDIDDVHELRAVAYLSEGFGASVLEPIRLHVQAKRYLAARASGYRLRLSPASTRSLALQGGPMSELDARLFEELPFAADAVQLRLYDDRAKQSRKRTPPLSHYLDGLGGLLSASTEPAHEHAELGAA
ncbi:MAG TPA: phosphohydrolase [Caldimonas sp.]|nr:phosphohydrolase [Caldimonas sp.]HEX4235891.1 phosphohydrolase [Caldimonas sp.]